MPVRNPAIVAFARHYGITIHTCVPADPASKGGSESSVKIAKADLVPKDTNLREQYTSFAELETACQEFCDHVNARVHRVTRRAPVEMLAEEHARLHPIPAAPHTVAFGVTRTVPPSTPMVSFEGGQYSVPVRLLGQTVWVRVHGQGAQEMIVLVHVGPTGPVEVARATPGSPKIDDDHFPHTPVGALERKPLARNTAEVEFLAIGDSARLWLSEAAAAGTTKIRVKMAQAVTLAKLFDTKDVDRALGQAAVHARFAEADLASILDHHQHTTNNAAVSRAGEDGSLTQGTASWAALGATPAPVPPVTGGDHAVMVNDARPEVTS